MKKSLGVRIEPDITPGQRETTRRSVTASTRRAKDKSRVRDSRHEEVDVHEDTIDEEKEFQDDHDTHRADTQDILSDDNVCSSVSHVHKTHNVAIMHGRDGQFKLGGESSGKNQHCNYSN
ncbi:hypothetical protein M5689_024615 [Euphorbia peplus]|nr:hypothetical protein M5689_024615 [Euphorbia peplus]